MNVNNFRAPRLVVSAVLGFALLVAAPIHSSEAGDITYVVSQTNVSLTGNSFADFSNRSSSIALEPTADQFLYVAPLVSSAVDAMSFDSQELRLIRNAESGGVTVTPFSVPKEILGLAKAREGNLFEEVLFDCALQANRAWGIAVR